MRVQLRNNSLALLLLGSVMLLGACQKKCQPGGERLKTIIDTEFRLVQTSEPTVKNDLTNTNFLTMTFRINYVGEVHRVVDNDRYDNPVSVFRYNIDPNKKEIRVQYYSPAAEGGEEAMGEAVGDVRTYRYDLSNELKLIDKDNGFNYRYVPFTGVVKPDEACVF